jgi:hypothetical protein
MTMSGEVVTHPAAAAEDRRRWLALAVIVTAQFMVVLDISIANVAHAAAGTLVMTSFAKGDPQ